MNNRDKEKQGAKAYAIIQYTTLERWVNKNRIFLSYTENVLFNKTY